MRKIINFLVTLSLLGIGVISNPQPKSYNLEESTSDETLSQEPTLLRKSVIGKDKDISYSEVYVQEASYTDGVNEAGEEIGYYCLRFVAAIKGNIESVSWQREHIDGIKDVARKEVNIVYKGISADDVVMYYDGEYITDNDNFAGDYYWTTYSIRFCSETAMDIFSAIEGKVMTATLYINDVAVGSKSKFLGDENSQEYKDYINDYYYEKYPVPNGKAEYEKSMFDDGNMSFNNNSNGVGYYYEFENAQNNGSVTGPLTMAGEDVYLVQHTRTEFCFEIYSEIETNVMLSINMLGVSTNSTREYPFTNLFQIDNAEDYDAFLPNSGNVNYHSINFLPNNVTFYYSNDVPENLILYRLGEIHLREGTNLIRIARLGNGAHESLVMVLDSIMLSMPID